jgi:zinc protease
MIRKLWISFLVAFITGEAVAQIDTSQKMPVDPKVKIGKLANGLTYYIRKNTKPENRVELRLVVNTGSVVEDPDQLGLAHFMEHMNFNGTRRFPKNELVSYLQSIGVQFGADLNAYTGFDETVYILPVPTDKPGLVDKGLEILDDWAHNALLDSLEVEKERGVVIEEWRLSRGAEERMMRQTLPVEYLNSKYAERLPIGTKESLEKFSHASLKRFYKEWYRPDLQAVIVVGDIDVNEMEAKIKQVFGDIPAAVSPRPRESFPVPDHQETLSVVAKDKETAFPVVQVMFKKDPQQETTIGDYSRYINRLLFTGMLNNRLRELAQKPNPPFIGAGSYYGNTYARTKDAFMLYANSSDTGMGKALSALLEEGRRVVLHGFTPTEFELQKKQLQSFYDRIFNEREKEESYKYVDEYVSNFLINEPIPGLEWEYDFVKQHLSSVKLPEINKLASAWITPHNMVVTMNAPEKTDIKIPSNEEVKQIVARVATAAIDPYKEKILASQLMDASKLKPGSIVSTKNDEDLGTTTWVLSNGATVVLKPTNFKNDEIIMRAYSKGGHSLVKDADYFSAYFASQIVGLSGIGNFTATDLNNMLKGRNTGLSTNISLYSEGLNGNTTPKESETLFQLMYLYFTAPRKDKDAFESFKTRYKQLYSNILADPNNYFADEFNKLLTKNHPRAGRFPKNEDFNKISLDRAIQIYKERFANAGDFTFFFVGSLNEDSLRRLVTKYIGSLPGTPKKETYRDLGIRPPTGKVEKQINKGSEQQSQVNMVFTGPATYNSDDAYALRSLGELLTIKLVEQLREEKGSVYGVGAFGNMQKVPYQHTMFNISFPCAPENVDTLTRAVLNEINKVIKNGVSETDLAKVKEQQKRRLEVDLKENRFWVNNLYDASFNGSNARQILDLEKKISELSSKAIQDAARKFVNPARYIRAVLKPGTADTKPLKPF